MGAPLNDTFSSPFVASFRGPFPKRVVKKQGNVVGELSHSF